jgi:predicted permease
MANDVILDRILGSVIPVLIVVMIGYLYGRWRKPNMSTINQVNMELFVPMLIFSVLASKSVDLTDYLPLTIGTLGIILGSAVLTWPICQLTGIQPKTLIPPMMFTNTGNLALPLVLLAFGEAAMPAMIVIFIISMFLHFTLGFYILDRRAKVLNALSIPTIFATFAGLFVGFTHTHIPDIALIPLDMLGQIVIPLGPLCTGCSYARCEYQRLWDWIICSNPLPGLRAWYCLCPATSTATGSTAVECVFGLRSASTGCTQLHDCRTL